MRIGIIGFGHVGGAIVWAHRSQDIIIRDPKLEHSASMDQFNTCDAVYVCVPTPSTEDGHCNTSILEQTLKELLFATINKQIPIICKSTAPPSVYARLQEMYPNIVHCPEFITARDANTDYQNTDYFVIGGRLDWCEKAREVIRTGVPLVQEKFVFTDIKTASMYKYMMNTYLATKVTFMNEMYRLAEAEGIEYNKLKELTVFDDRIGYTHLDVPGPDNEFGWGGMCFPKDIAAIQMEALDLGVDMELLGRVEDINKKHRKIKND